MKTAKINTIIDQTFNSLSALEQKAIGPHVNEIKVFMAENDYSVYDQDDISHIILHYFAEHWIGSPEHAQSYN